MPFVFIMRQSSSVPDMVKNWKIVKEKIEKLKEIWEDLDDVLGDLIIDLGVYERG